MNINMMRCLEVQENNIVRQIQLGSTKIKFCNDCIVNTKEERERVIREFKQAFINLQVRKAGE